MSVSLGLSGERRIVQRQRDRLPSMLGVTTVEFAGHPVALTLHDATLA
ncbi:hypothetical protein [Burkholderia cenocepacia]